MLISRGSQQQLWGSSCCRLARSRQLLLAKCFPKKCWRQETWRIEWVHKVEVKCRSVGTSRSLATETISRRFPPPCCSRMPPKNEMYPSQSAFLCLGILVCLMMGMCEDGTLKCNFSKAEVPWNILQNKLDKAGSIQQLESPQVHLLASQDCRILAELAKKM